MHLPLPARSTLGLLASLAALAVAGCGGEGEPASPPSLADAKATLSKDCQQGKASDKPLCDCIADELAEAGNDAKEIQAIGEAVNGGEEPAALGKAAAGC